MKLLLTIKLHLFKLLFLWFVTDFIVMSCKCTYPSSYFKGNNGIIRLGWTLSQCLV